MRPIPEVTNLDIVFGSDAMNILPPMKDIPESFRGWNKTPWHKIAERWFFKGAKDLAFVPKEGVNKTKALRAIACCLRSFEPSQEHKIWDVAFLMSEWFATWMEN